jgi:hypothetical protein
MKCDRVNPLVAYVRLIRNRRSAQFTRLDCHAKAHGYRIGDLGLGRDNSLDQIGQFRQGFSLFVIIGISVVDAPNAGDGVTQHPLANVGADASAR